MNNFKKVLLSKLPEFKDYTLNFINGNISKSQYRDFSSRYGVYAQKDGKTFMIRLRTNCGIMPRCKLHTIYQIAHKYDVEFIHLTTRQNIQLHGIKMDSIMPFFKEGIEKDIFTTCSNGNFPQNIIVSPLSGVDVDESFDVIPYALENDRYFLNKTTIANFPKKFKVSYSSSFKNFGHATTQDLGFVATTKGNRIYFEVYVGGNLGKNPNIGVKLNELIPPTDVLYYVEAMIEFFIDENDPLKNKEREIRFLVDKLGIEKFTSKFQEYVEYEKNSKNLKISPHPIDYTKKGMKIPTKHPRLISQKQDGLYTVVIHPFGGIYKLKDFKTLLNELDKIKNPIIRIGLMQDIYIINLDGNEAKKILEITESVSGDTDLENSICCIGSPICQISECNSQKLLSKIVVYFKSKSQDKKNLEVMPRLYISGCINSCGAHHIAEIGFCGKILENDSTCQESDSCHIEYFEMSIDGSFSAQNTKLSKVIGLFKSEDIPEMLYEISEFLLENQISFKSLINSYVDDFDIIISKYKC